MAAAAFIRPYKPSDFAATAHICRATLPPSLADSEAAVRLAPYVWTHQYTLLSPGTCLVLDDGAGAAVGYVIGCPDVFVFARGYGRYVDEVLLQPAALDGHGGGGGGGGGGPAAAVPAPRQLDRLAPWLVTGGTAAGDVVREDGLEGPGPAVINEECLAQLAHSPRFLLFGDGGGDGSGARGALVGRFRATMHIDLLEGWQGKGWGRKMIGEFVASVKDACAASAAAVREGGLDCGEGVHIGVGWENKKVVPFYEKAGFKVYEDCYEEGETIWMVYEF
ncbi:hypothetical protein KVR01_000281 [Diaporthe batatas]|uniref:uncharacterized protein n=1 Tax=Diaporthe batatas TaxID=748121 RepID=UPI001D0461A2|nr:uncharacterized protein KVR01_000281 [Diaporthe batatas]KAG8169536.1 hypothetical protein KVR01_000281 [Diaporthe batatas]